MVHATSLRELLDDLRRWTVDGCASDVKYAFLIMILWPWPLNHWSSECHPCIMCLVKSTCDQFHLNISIYYEDTKEIKQTRTDERTCGQPECLMSLVPKQRRHKTWFLANVKVSSHYMSSSVRLSSVCLSSVTLVLPTRDWNVSQPFGTLAIRWSPQKILRRLSQGNLSVGD